MTETISDTSYREIFWDLTSSSQRLRNSMLGLRVLPGEEALFGATAPHQVEVEISPPRPFLDTALAGPQQQSWRRQPIEEANAKRLGGGMWQSLPPMVQDDLRQRPGDTGPVLLKIGCTLSGVDDIPWEWLRKGDGQPFALDPNARLVRCVPVRYAAPPLSIQLPIRVLVVITNPKDERLLEPQRELQVLQEGLRVRGGSYDVQQLLEPRTEALAAALEKEPHILHYIGHAGVSHGAGCIILHDEYSGTEWIPATRLSAMLPASVRLLCLSTCVTTQNYQIEGLPKLAMASSDTPLPSTICNQYPLQPDSAEAFWRTFYPALLAQDGSVLEAFHEARAAVSKAGPVATCDWASFCLVIRNRSGHPFRLSAGGEDSNRFASEIQAQFAARFANNLADRLRYYGGDAPEQLKRSVDDAWGTLSNITRTLK
jgi:hypothetical protein